MPEVRVLRAGREDQILEGNATSFSNDFAAFNIHAADPSEHHTDVPRIRQNGPHWRRNVAWRKARGRDLVQQRLEQMIIVLIDHCHVERAAGKPLRGGQPAETGPDNDNARIAHGLSNGTASNPNMGWRSLWCTLRRSFR